MPRQQTAAEERTEQNHRLRREVAAQLGKDSVPLKVAQDFRRSEAVRIKDRELDYTDEMVRPIGTILARVQDFKIVRGRTAYAGIASDADEFGQTMLDIARLSHSSLLVLVAFEIPRNLGLDDEDVDDDEWGE